MTNLSKSLGSGGQQGGRDTPVGSMLRQSEAQQNELQAAARATFRDVANRVAKHMISKCSEHFEQKSNIIPNIRNSFWNDTDFATYFL